MMSKRKKTRSRQRELNKIENIISVVVVSIALGSFIVAINSMRIASYQAEQSRVQTEHMMMQFSMMTDQLASLNRQINSIDKYAKRSTVPNLMVIQAQDYEGSEGYGYYLDNGGPGVAIITEIKLEVNDKYYDVFNQASLDEAFSVLGLTTSQGIYLRPMYFTKPNLFIKAGESRYFLVINRKITAEAVNKFKNALSQTTLKITYRSEYDDYEVIRKKLE
jgi:hypothetical protein